MSSRQGEGPAAKTASLEKHRWEKFVMGTRVGAGMWSSTARPGHRRIRLQPLRKGSRPSGCEKY